MRPLNHLLRRLACITAPPTAADVRSLPEADLSLRCEQLEARMLLDGVLESGVTHSGAINPAGDVDTWTFTAQAGDSLVYSYGLTGGYDFSDVRVYAPDGSLVGTINSTDDYRLTLTGTQAGAYTFEIFSAHPSETSTYQHTLVRVPGSHTLPTDEGAFTNGVTTDHTVGIGDIDLFTFEAAAGDSVVYSQSWEDGSQFADVTFFNPDGSILYDGNSQDHYGLTFTDLVAGTYTVTVSNAVPSMSRDYRHTLLTASGGLSGSPDERLFVNGETSEHSLGTGDIDAFRFEAEAGDSVVYALGLTGGFDSVDLRVFGPDGAVMASHNADDDFRLTFTDLDAGEYTVAIVGSHANQTSIFQHTLVNVGGDFARIGDEHAFLNGHTTTHRLVIGDVDVFTFDAAAGDSVHYVFADDGGLRYADVTFFNPDGSLLYDGDGRDNYSLTFTDLAAGTYVVTVASTAPAVVNDYRHTLTQTSADTSPTPGAADSIIGLANGQSWWRVGRSPIGGGVFNEHIGSWEGNVSRTHILKGDFNGDGRVDIATRRASDGDWTVHLIDALGGGMTASRWGRWSTAVTWDDARVGDFNGDGRDDIAGRVNGNWWVQLSTGSSFTSTYFGRWSTAATWNDVSVGDFNGDGRADIAGRVNGNWWVSLSTGDEFVVRHFGRWSTAVAWQDVSIGDFDGNGRDDIAGRVNGTWWVSLSSGSDFIVRSLGRWSQNATWTDVAVGDFDGDGRDDIAGRANGNWWVSLSRTSGFATQYFGRWSTSVTWEDVTFADFNGDGRTDIAGRANGNWWVASSTGASFTNEFQVRWSDSANWTHVSAGVV